MSKRKISFFISYAHKNVKAKEEFLELFQEQCAPDKLFEFQFWNDEVLKVGDKWDSAIQTALKQCDFGLLLLSPSFLGSNYITQYELPTYASGEKNCFPIMLCPIDFERHDLKGIQEIQIFRLPSKRGKQLKAFTDLKTTHRREDFVRELYMQIHDKLKSDFSCN